MLIHCQLMENFCAAGCHWLKVAWKCHRWGGARRLPVPIVCQDSLTNVLENHVKEVGVSVAFFFGAYEHLGRSQAVHAAGLKFNEKLLWNLIKFIVHV